MYQNAAIQKYIEVSIQNGPIPSVRLATEGCAQRPLPTNPKKEK